MIISSFTQAPKLVIPVRLGLPATLLRAREQQSQLIMSRIWDALQKIEKERDDAASGTLSEFADLSNVRLDAKQRLAVRALLRTSTLEAAAKAADVEEDQLRKWLAQPAFVSAYYDAGRSEIEMMMEKLDAATQKALAVLEQAGALLRSVGNSPPSDADSVRRTLEKARRELRDE